jgi:membrane associated rhomboid family serine protease
MTYIIIAFTALITIQAFRNNEWFSKLQFNAYQVVHRNEYHRLLTHGFLHANWTHLIVNMLVLFFFGPLVQGDLRMILPARLQPLAQLIFLFFYLASIIVASLVTMVKQKNNAWYNAVGASGAVSAVIFFYIFFNPWELIYFYGIIPVPGIIMGVIYLVYSHAMSRRNADNVNHDAHLVGAIFGFIFPLFINVHLFTVFIQKLFSFSF